MHMYQSCFDGNVFQFVPRLLQNQQHVIEVEIETQKSHRKHFETKLKELQDSIKKAEREHETMKKLVRVSVFFRPSVRSFGRSGRSFVLFAP